MEDSKENKGLEPLKICSFDNGDFSGKPKKTFTALINPSDYSNTINIKYKDNENLGKTKGSPKYEKYAPETMGFKITLDGTGVVPLKKDQSFKTVETLIEELKTVVSNFNGSIHEPNYVQIIWGTMIFNGRLKSLKLDYKLFKSDGSPLRAVATLDFMGFTSKKESTAEENKSSPDLSHFITFKAGDTLPNLCYKIYNDSTYCNEVAEINELQSYRNIKPGTQLLFPPLIKHG